MIIGIGSDIVALHRIKKLLTSRKEIFLKKILTKKEQSFLQHNRLDGYVANRFAAKEAFSKALGTGIGEHVSFQDLEITKTTEGKPFFVLSDKLKNYIEEKFGNKINIQLSMSNEAEYAHAIVIIETY